jgi:hypothetical protein
MTGRHLRNVWQYNVMSLTTFIYPLYVCTKCYIYTIMQNFNLDIFIHPELITFEQSNSIDWINNCYIRLLMKIYKCTGTWFKSPRDRRRNCSLKRRVSAIFRQLWNYFGLFLKFQDKHNIRTCTLSVQIRIYLHLPRNKPIWFSNSYKPIANTAWVRARLCKLQKRVHSIRSRKWQSLPVACPWSVVLSEYSGFFHH